MIFKNLKDNRIAKATSPKIIAEYMAKTKENKDLKPEEIEWEIGTEFDLTEEEKLEPTTQINIAEIERLTKIDNLKQNLADTDYQAIKYAEGQMTEAEYKPMKAQRQVWRDEINKLEQM